MLDGEGFDLSGILTPRGGGVAHRWAQSSKLFGLAGSVLQSCELLAQISDKRVNNRLRQVPFDGHLHRINVFDVADHNVCNPDTDDSVFILDFLQLFVSDSGTVQPSGNIDIRTSSQFMLQLFHLFLKGLMLSDISRPARLLNLPKMVGGSILTAKFPTLPTTLRKPLPLPISKCQPPI